MSSFACSIRRQQRPCCARRPSDVIHARIGTVLAEGPMRSIDQFRSYHEPTHGVDPHIETIWSRTSTAAIHTYLKHS